LFQQLHQLGMFRMALPGISCVFSIMSLQIFASSVLLSPVLFAHPSVKTKYAFLLALRKQADQNSPDNRCCPSVGQRTRTIN